jgi:hypothetical protein
MSAVHLWRFRSTGAFADSTRRPGNAPQFAENRSSVRPVTDGRIALAHARAWSDLEFDEPQGASQPIHNNGLLARARILRKTPPLFQGGKVGQDCAPFVTKGMEQCRLTKCRRISSSLAAAWKIAGRIIMGPKNQLPGGAPHDCCRNLQASRRPCAARSHPPSQSVGRDHSRRSSSWPGAAAGQLQQTGRQQAVGSKK